LKTSCNTRPYGVATNDLKQIENLASFSFWALEMLAIQGGALTTWENENEVKLDRT
jgi:hypothetical protein